ncbi:YbaB/EbfC family nucleoid-associated protein [Mycobacterium sp. Aquia_216]|uniref:YbaB/EbfC family nucleoid-associated protein n=1 Tax=Mycobacterium sp. Aquia_216 TaxID=2991729 RepID=UPI00227B341A|nr:YbaB/EbfC family nucleoid-associated protein [Mycobacterium sp. Aquia_216]WAJ44254.1 YbaB/EbfC family nucleoid-associated protein [Mycobacterium sp. Aquia_216]
MGRVQGTAADGRVTVTVSSTGELLGVHVDPGPYQPEDPPGLENMGDMVVEALIDAKTKALSWPRPSRDC